MKFLQIKLQSYSPVSPSSLHLSLKERFCLVVAFRSLSEFPEVVKDLGDERPRSPSMFFFEGYFEGNSVASEKKGEGEVKERVKSRAREPEESGRKGPPRATSRPGSPCGPCYASRRPHPFCSPRPSSPTSFLLVFLFFSPRLNSALLSSADINLGRLHLYLMLPISRLIPSPPSTAPLRPSSPRVSSPSPTPHLSLSLSLAHRLLY